QRDGDPIGGANDQPRTGPRTPPGVAEEIRDPQRRDQPRPAGRAPQQEQNDRRQRRRRDEFPAVRVNRGKDAAQHGSATISPIRRRALTVGPRTPVPVWTSAEERKGGVTPSRAMSRPGPSR